MSIIGRLRTGRRVAFVSACTLVGVTAAGFALPDETPAWAWAVSSLLALIIANAAALRAPVSDSAAQPDTRAKRKGWVIAGGAILLLAADLVWSHLSKRP